MTGLQQRAAGIAARIGLTGLVAAVLGAALVVQTVRLKGFHVWPVSVTGWIKTAQDRQATIDRIAEAQHLAEAEARAARLAQESTYRDIAERIDENATDTLETALAAADRFIAAGGLRGQAPGRAPGCARTAASDHRAEDPDRTRRPAQLDAAGAGAADAGPAAGFVLVSAEDIRICTTNTVKAEAGRDLALQLEAASKPQPAPE